MGSLRPKNVIASPKFESLMRKKKWIITVGVILLALSPGWAPLIPLPFMSPVWKSNIARRNMISDIYPKLENASKANVISMLGHPGDFDKKGIDANSFFGQGDEKTLYYFVPVLWENCALVIRFDQHDKVSNVQFIDGQ